MRAGRFVAAYALLAAVLQSSPADTQPAACAGARAVLKRFLELDATTGRKWTPQLTSLVIDEDNPGWDTQLVIARYAIGPCQTAAQDFRLPVTYWIAGKLTSAGENGLPLFIPSLALERVTFDVVHADRGFKIRNVGVVSPRVYPDTAIAELKVMANERAPAPRQQAVRTATQLVRETAARLRHPR